MRYICAPDLPFGETVVWYLKQMAAHVVIVVGVFLLLLIAALILDKLGVIKL